VVTRLDGQRDDDFLSRWIELRRNAVGIERQLAGVGRVDLEVGGQPDEQGPYPNSQAGASAIRSARLRSVPGRRGSVSTCLDCS